MSATEGRGHLDTERENERTAALDALPVAEAVALMIAEDRAAFAAVEAAHASIATAVELAAERLADGGRLFYFGAGTSGRLGVLDASECPPTFQSDPEQVQGIIAGGDVALRNAVEGAEDSAADAAAEVEARGIGPRDIVLAISAGGTTPYAHGAIDAARARGAATVFLACVPFAQAGDRADVSIRCVTGPEVVAGSTRLKAGTATKLALNLISTLTMVQLGKVHGNLMVDVDTSANTKLVDRGERLVMRIAGVDRSAAAELLRRGRGRVKLAVVMAVRNVDVENAEHLIERAGGRLGVALDPES
ncbi:MAG: N-acetylmuramic acid 6-phosphate etherase [bacterium]|nr:N-acetylmuramic acid 6-phosphate etherase [bacterium]